MSFKDNWEKKDILCEHCGAIVKRQRGITKQNLKRLIKPRLTWDEFLITLMIIMVLAIAFLYQSETKTCRAWLKDFSENPEAKCRMILYGGSEGLNSSYNVKFNASEFEKFMINQTKINSWKNASG